MTETAKLTASDAAANDQLGYSVSIYGDVAVIGAPGDDDGGDRSGSAYVFEKPPGGWVDMTETTKLTASDATVRVYFGHSVSINGDVAVIGARGDSSSQGSAYVFRFDGNWIEEAKLTASDGATFDFFGHEVSVGGDMAVIGASGSVVGSSAYICGRFSDCQPNGIPDECEADCNNNGRARSV